MTRPDGRAPRLRRLLDKLATVATLPGTPILGLAVLGPAVLGQGGLVAASPPPSAPAVAQSASGPGSICGRAGDVSRLLLDLQKPAAERLWRDTKLFVLRDHDDGSLWAFSIKNSNVHPAVRCRRPSPGDPSSGTDTGLLCPASEAACASFAAQADGRFDAAGAAGTPPR